MKSPGAGLLWKEWREHRGMIAAIAIAAPVVLALASYLNADGVTDSVFAGAAAALTLFVPLVSLFVGMNAAAGEQSRGTIGFLQALPVPMRKAAGAKLFWATVTVAAPVVMILALVLTWRIATHGFAGIEPALIPQFEAWRNRIWGASNWYFGWLLGGVVSGASLTWWLAAAGVNRSDEVRAAAVASLVIAGCWVTFSHANFILDLSPGTVRTVAAVMPGGAGTLTAAPPRAAPAQAPPWMDEFGPALAAAVISHALVVCVYLLRFGRVKTKPERGEPVASIERTWLAPPRRSPASAILWKQARESTPLAALGATLILAIVAAGGLGQRLWFPNATPEDLWGISAGAYMMVGIFVSVVAGVGLFLDDLKPGIHTFWRSRPIAPAQWFWLKFLTGLLTTLMLLIIAPLAAAAVLAMIYDPAEFLPANRPAELWGPAAVVLMVQVGVYSAAAAAMAVVRQPVVAALLAVGGLAATAFIVSVIERQTRHGWAPQVAFSLAMILAAIWLAWVAIVRNWGRSTTL